MGRLDRIFDPSAASQAELSRALQALFEREPRLRPRPEIHDYQLTYPPAVQLEREERHRRRPSESEWKELAVGEFSAAGYYFHFGFCKYRCRYCFHYELTTKQNDDLMGRYVDALALEMKQIKALSPVLRRALYFLGGGTPTALPTKLLERFLGSLLLHLGPPMTSMSTVEAKPITLDDNGKIDALVAAGFRRINLGVQTLDPKLYAFHHHKEELRIALEAIDRVREQGFEFVNIDLMIGLEGQTPESWELSLSALERLATSGRVDSVFIYPFHDDPRSRTYDQPGAIPTFEETAFADAQARALMSRLGWKELGARFYRSPRHVRREILDLAKVRVNPAYGEVLYHGFGNSSFSIGDRATYINHRDAVSYCDSVESGELPIVGWASLTDQQRATRDVTFDLLYSPMTRVRSRAKKYGAKNLKEHEWLLDHWVDLGLGTHNRWLGTFSLTPFGKLVHQQMIPLHYLPEDRTEHKKVLRVRQELGRRYRGY